jgi:hypothetical protein
MRSWSYKCVLEATHAFVKLPMRCFKSQMRPALTQSSVPRAGVAVGGAGVARAVGAAVRVLVLTATAALAEHVAVGHDETRRAVLRADCNSECKEWSWMLMGEIKEGGGLGRVEEDRGAWGFLAEHVAVGHDDTRRTVLRTDCNSESSAKRLSYWIWM